MKHCCAWLPAKAGRTLQQFIIIQQSINKATNYFVALLIFDFKNYKISFRLSAVALIV